MSKGGCLTSRKTQLSDSKIRCTQERVTKSGAGCTTQYSAPSTQRSAPGNRGRWQAAAAAGRGHWHLQAALFHDQFFILFLSPFGYFLSQWEILFNYHISTPGNSGHWLAAAAANRGHRHLLQALTPRSKMQLRSILHDVIMHNAAALDYAQSCSFCNAQCSCH